MSRFGYLAAALAISMAAGGCSNGDRRNPSPESPAVGTGGAGTTLKNDNEFVHKVAMMHTAQVELSRMALQKATSPQIKFYAQRMIDDHGAAVNKLKGVVSEASGQWPGQLDEKHRKPLDELAKEQATDFDREYTESMVKMHQDLAAILESRLDVQSLSDWKTAAAGRAQSQTMPDPNTQMRDVPVRPAASDSALTGKINQWAAETYPATQKHLDTARTLENAAKKGSD